MNKSKPSSSKSIKTQFDSKFNDLKLNFDANFNRLGQFLNDKYEATSGQLYFKLDLIEQELKKTNKVILDLTEQFTLGLKVIDDKLSKLEIEIFKL